MQTAVYSKLILKKFNLNGNPVTRGTNLKSDYFNHFLLKFPKLYEATIWQMSKDRNTKKL